MWSGSEDDNDNADDEPGKLCDDDKWNPFMAAAVAAIAAAVPLLVVVVLMLVLVVVVVVVGPVNPWPAGIDMPPPIPPPIPPTLTPPPNERPSADEAGLLPSGVPTTAKSTLLQFALLLLLLLLRKEVVEIGMLSVVVVPVAGIDVECIRAAKEPLGIPLLLLLLLLLSMLMLLVAVAASRENRMGEVLAEVADRMNPRCVCMR